MFAKATEIEAVKKAVRKEQETNEQLADRLNRVTSEVYFLFVCLFVCLDLLLLLLCCCCCYFAVAAVAVATLLLLLLLLLLRLLLLLCF